MKLTSDHIKELIEERYVERGKSYVSSGMVELVDVNERRARARCAGTRLYYVELRMGAGRLSGDCTCRAFSDFGPCKHMAATALAIIGHGQNTYRPSPAYLARRNEFEALERQLKRRTKAELIDLILRWTEDDPDLLASFIEGKDS